GHQATLYFTLSTTCLANLSSRTNFAEWLDHFKECCALLNTRLPPLYLRALMTARARLRASQ
ncbi:MAG TPA: hypothetical protein VFR24_07860, partial [Candidatus Angelobacter sp.]|nr:hypothetical protein [Candidatus Angelobacter sp.]